jgi:hypothetical protein
MKPYDYLLFRIYRFYTDKMEEREIPLFYTSVASSVLVVFNLLAIHSLLKYFELIPTVNKYFILIIAFLLWGINNFLIVKKKRFLERKFIKNIKGGWLVIIYIVLTAVFSIIIANYNRNKIFKGRSLDLTELNISNNRNYKS